MVSKYPDKMDVIITDIKILLPILPQNSTKGRMARWQTTRYRRLEQGAFVDKRTFAKDLITKPNETVI
jgi:hypothetical protein